MGCAAASLTPPNVSAASLEGDALRSVGPVNSSSSNSSALACRLDKDVKVTCLLNYTKDVYTCVRVATIYYYVYLSLVCQAKPQLVTVTMSSASG